MDAGYQRLAFNCVRSPERVIPRMRALPGKDVPFELEWVSIYTFSCLRMAHFRDRRVLGASTSASAKSAPR